MVLTGERRSESWSAATVKLSSRSGLTPSTSESASSSFATPGSGAKPCEATVSPASDARIVVRPSGRGSVSAATGVMAIA